jgi:copper chaperone CopZ
MAKVILNVPDISCGHCAKTVTEALTPIQGIRVVNVDIPTKRVQVLYDAAQVNVDQMKAVLQEEDYPVAAVETA